MKAIGRLTDGRLILEVAPQELVDLDEAARTILLTVGTVRAGLSAELAAGVSVTAKDETVRKGGVAGVAGKRTEKRKYTPRKGKKSARKFNKAADLAVQHCDVCGQDYQPRRCDQKAHGKTCPGKGKAEKISRRGAETQSVGAPVQKFTVAVTNDAAKIRALREAKELERDRLDGMKE